MCHRLVEPKPHFTVVERQKFLNKSLLWIVHTIEILKFYVKKGLKRTKWNFFESYNSKYIYHRSHRAKVVFYSVGVTFSQTTTRKHPRFQKSRTTIFLLYSVLKKVRGVTKNCPISSRIIFRSVEILNGCSRQMLSTPLITLSTPAMSSADRVLKWAF